MFHSSQPYDGTGDAANVLPQKSGAPDCLYYVRTGRCDYGINCRFNHPPKKNLDEAFERKDGYPEREGQPECQFYLKTGNCKFGSTCKYHHPKEKAGILGKTMANGAGYPLRLGEKDCAYYMRTGTCRFGMLCRYNHPQPACFSAIMAGIGAPSIAKEPSVQGLPLHSSCYAPFLVPPEGLMPMLGWPAYQRPSVPISHSNMKQHTYEVPALYGAASGSIPFCASYSPYMVASSATSLVHSNSSHKDTNFPMRPGQPECKYYIKTGDCKFGASCHFDHPKRCILSKPDYSVSSQGLPERPGSQPCGYYMHYGSCKYGNACRFDHPTTSFTYSSFPKSLMNFYLFPYPQNLAFPTFLHSSINTLGGANVQECSKDNEPALVEEKPLASSKGLKGKELRGSLNGGESKA